MGRLDYHAQSLLREAHLVQNRVPAQLTNLPIQVLELLGVSLQAFRG